MNYIIITKAKGITFIRLRDRWEQQANVDFSNQSNIISFSSRLSAQNYSSFLKDSESDCKNKIIQSATLTLQDGQWIISVN
ncbi:hypothetical protein BWI92_24385 [Flectobacillus sp. BAB-3569]|nr:hypothetical protein BWI92_24385 [Flectobacillus sp. BAB-3569]